MNPIPAELRTERLFLRSWRAGDAVDLQPILDANAVHLRRWIPAHVAEPAPLPELRQRLAGFAEDFRSQRNFRYAIFTAPAGLLCGEVSLFPRSATDRVALASADRMEIGYWLRRDVTGRGYATEAATATFQLASSLPGISQVEIRCDPANGASAAVPRRLGFSLLPAETESLMLWAYTVPAG